MYLGESTEMYLETIYLLLQSKPAVRSVDVAEHMGFSKPSVSRAVGLLKRCGFLVADENGCLSFTQDGLAAAKKIYDRHTVLSEFLARIGVSGETAAKDACKIEHVVSDETIGAIKGFLRKQPRND